MTAFILFIFSTMSLWSGVSLKSLDSTIEIASGANFVVNQALSLSGGTLALASSSATLSGSGLISGTNFILKDSSNEITFSGSLNPSATDAITLNDQNYLKVNGVFTLTQTISVANAATATIAGSPIFSSAITLGNSSSVLQLNINSTLNQSVSGAGKVKLLSDLIVDKSIQLPSLVDQSGKKITFNGGTASVAITNTGGGEISLDGNLSLTQLWTIGTSSEVYYLNGNGSVLTLSSSGGITFNGANLFINNCTIAGIATANALNGTGTINFSGCTLILANNFLRSDGAFVFSGENSTVVTNGSTWTMSGSGKNITVSGSVLYYQQLDGTDTNPFVYTSSATQVLSSSGLVQSSLKYFNGLRITAASFSLTKDYLLSSSAPLQISNNVAFDGGGHFLSFPNATGTFLTLDNSRALTFTNTVLNNYNPSAISFGTSASIVFSDGVRMVLGQNILISSSDPAWNFTGNAEIDGEGATLIVDKSAGLTINNASKVLTLRNMRLYLKNSNALRALNDSSKIVLDNVELVLHSAGYNYAQGNLDISGNVKITGGSVTSNPSSSFNFSTSGILTVLDNSVLEVDRNINFQYNATPAAGDNTVYLTKRHLVLSTQGSVFKLNGATLSTTTTGIALDSGTLIINDKVTLNISTSTAAQMEIGSSVRAILSSGATLDITGPVSYIA